MLADLFGSEEAARGFLTLAAAGFSAMMSVLAFYYFVNTSARERAVKKRMTVVSDHRRALRSEVLSTATERNGGARAGSSKQRLEIMQSALSVFRMKEQLEEGSLKLRLARAGLRSRAAAVSFLFAQVAAPPALAVGAMLYYYFFMHAPSADILNVLFAGLAGGMIGYIGPGMYLDNKKSGRQKKMISAYPDMLDLMTICVESGMSIEQSFAKVAKEIGPNAPELSEELQLTTAELAFLGDRRQALENLADRTDLAQVRAITSALIQAEKYGTPVGQALRVASAESRNERMSRAEQKAAALPAKLTVPMMVFFLPVLFIVILGPSIISIQEAF